MFKVLLPEEQPVQATRVLPCLHGLSPTHSSEGQGWAWARRGKRGAVALGSWTTLKHPDSDGLEPTTDGLQPTSDGLQPSLHPQISLFLIRK